MASYLIDLDGVFFQYGSMQPIEGAVDYVKRLQNQGHNVIFLTKRRSVGNEPEHLSIDKTKAVLDTLGVMYQALIEDVDSPRILINDEGAVAINHPRNALFGTPREVEASPLPRQTVVARVQDALSAVAWVAWNYGHSGDADDYVQTILVANSLIASNGFDHRDLVSRYRKPTAYKLEGKALGPSGIHPEYGGQISKLLRSDDPLFQASDGVADGAAMKMTAAAAYYLDDFRRLVESTDRIARVTHATVEARLAALLVVLRLRQAFLGVHPNCPEALVNDLWVASEQLKFGDRSCFFMDRVGRAKGLVRQNLRPANLLACLAENIGMEHLAWSTPISAVFWSFHQDPHFGTWFRNQWRSRNTGRMDEKRLKLPKNRWGFARTIDGRTLKSSVHEEDVNHLRAIGQLDEYTNSHGYHWGSSVDTDTFFSIAISILAARLGLNMVRHEVRQALDLFGDDLASLAGQLVPEVVPSTGAAQGTGTVGTRSVELDAIAGPGKVNTD